MRVLPGKGRWLWVILLLLLAAGLAGRRLNTWPILIDEAATMISAGARNFGPLSLAESLTVQHSRWPDQAFGWVLLENLWGRLAGWSTVAVRALSWFAGLLTLALVYRVGRGLFTTQVGMYATLVLATSQFFLIYMHVARVFTVVALFATLTLWGYWRVALHPRAPGRGSQVGLLLGAVGLLYAHYFAALLLPALGLYHLFFVRKDGRWWRGALLLALVALSALPELVVLGGGVEMNVERYGASPSTMNVAEAPGRLLFVLTNGLVRLQRQAGPLLLFLLALSPALLLRHRTHATAFGRAAWYLAVVSLLCFALTLLVNEYVPVLMSARMRYLMALWPPLVMLLAGGLARLGRRQQRPADWALAALVAGGVFLNLRAPLHLGVDFFPDSRLHLADQALTIQARADDFLLLDEALLPETGRIREYYTTVLAYPRELVTLDEEHGQYMERAQEHARVWLLVSRRGSTLEGALEGSMAFCQRPVSGEDNDMTLTLYARTADDCA